MRQLSLNINLQDVLNKLQQDTVISLECADNYIIVSTAQDTNQDIKRIYINDSTFRNLYAEKVNSTLICGFDTRGNLYVQNEASLSPHQRQLWQALQQSVKQKTGDIVDVVLTIIFFIMLLSFVALFVDVGPGHVVKDPFAALDVITYVEPEEPKPGKYRVTIDGYSRVFNIESIENSHWEAEDGVTLWVSDTLDIWKGNTLVLRTSDFKIEEVKE